MDVRKNKPSSPSIIGIFEGTHDTQIDGSKFTNVGGDSSSSTFIFIKHESGISLRSILILVLLLLTCLFSVCYYEEMFLRVCSSMQMGSKSTTGALANELCQRPLNTSPSRYIISFKLDSYA